MPVEPFANTLARHRIHLSRGRTHTLQVNVGLLCNQACRHCHLEAGPGRRELMPPEVIAEVLEFAARCGFETVDITGGAPELHPQIGKIIEGFASLTPRLLLRSNLTAIADPAREGLAELCAAHRVGIVASLPSASPGQLESQRGQGAWQSSIDSLRRLNALGYGRQGSGLTLDLVVNPTGAFLPSPQQETERRFRSQLRSRFDLLFNSLYVFANVPLGRFRRWLLETGNLDAYLHKLAAAFNPCTVDGLMCRSLLSVSWDGYLFDCDFNQAERIYAGGRRLRISELPSPPPPATPITVSDHCYACTAGAGFT